MKNTMRTLTLILGLGFAAGRAPRSRLDLRWPEARRRCASPRRCRPRSRAATSSSPASSPACRNRGRAGCAFASRSTRRAARRSRCGAARCSRSAGTRASTRTRRWSSRSAELRAGQRWRFTRAAAPAARQPQSAWLRLRAGLFEQGVRATGYVRDAPRAAAARRARPAHPVERLRQRVRDAIYAQRRRPARRRRAGRARGRRPGRDRARRLGPVPQHRRRPPDVDQRPARHDVRLARRRR